MVCSGLLELLFLNDPGVYLDLAFILSNMGDQISSVISSNHCIEYIMYMELLCTLYIYKLITVVFSLATGRDKGREKLLANEKSNYKLLYQKVHTYICTCTCTHIHY